MKWNPTNRRHFLQSTSGLCLSLPFLASLAPKAFADENAIARKNFICLFKPNGCYPDHYFPHNMYSEYIKNSKVSKLGPDMTEISLDVFERLPISPLFDLNFSKISQYLNIYLGLSTKENNHNGAIPFATSKNWPSIDHIVAKSKNFDPELRPSLAIQSSKMGYKDNPTSIDLVNGKVVSNEAIADPISLFQILFDNTQSLAGNDREGDTKLRQMIAEQTALDTVLEDANRLMNDTKLGAADKKIVEQYLDFVRAKEKQISSLIKNGDTLSASNSNIPSKPKEDEMNDPLKLIDTMIDLMVAAIKTNQAHAFNFQLATSVDETSFPLSDPTYTVRPFHSGISHDQSKKADHLAMDRYLFSKIPLIWQKLNQPTSSNTDQTYADHSCLYTSGDMGAGEIPSHHTSHSAIAFTLSGKHIPIKTGRAISYSSEPKTKGYPHNQLLIGLMEAMGASDWRSILNRNGKSLSSGYGEYGGTQKAISESEKEKPLQFLIT